MRDPLGISCGGQRLQGFQGPPRARLDGEPVVLAGLQPGETGDRNHCRIVGTKLDSRIVHAGTLAARGFSKSSP